MNRAGVTEVVRVIALNLISLARQVLEDDSVSVNEKVGRNTLADSNLYKQLEYRVDTSGDPVIEALFNHYVVYLEWERPPRYGKKPPISALIDWARKNGISTDASTLWAISTAIWRDGHAGRPIFANLEGLTDKAFNDEWADTLFGAITNDLDNYFND